MIQSHPFTPSQSALLHGASVLICTSVLLCAATNVARAQPDAAPTLNQLKAAAALRSNYLNHQLPASTEAPKPQLAAFRNEVAPLLTKTCAHCHGEDTQEGNLRIDTLNPDLLHGDDVTWWLEILAVLTNGEMPPPDEGQLTDKDRSRIIEWLSSEIQVASMVRRDEQGHSSFRRMTRYEYNYALQDLLGLPYDFAKDLPPDSNSEDGFQNSSELLNMSATQLSLYRKLSRDALQRATVRGERPEPLYWGVSMKDAAKDFHTKYEADTQEIKDKHQDDPEALNRELEAHAAKHRAPANGPRYLSLTTGAGVRTQWNYRKAQLAWSPTASPPEVPEVSDYVAVIPPRQKLIVELGDRVPEAGLLRVRVRASQAMQPSTADGSPEGRQSDRRAPSLRLEFGWQASNDSQATVRVSEHDLSVDATADNPKFYQWDIPLSEIYPRNSFRNVTKLGDLPNPSEYIRLVNSTITAGDIQFDYVEITAPVYHQWPPASHTRIFIDSENQADDTKYAREVLSNFMTRAWRRPVSVAEVDRKLKLFTNLRKQSDDFQGAMIEVLATVLASPQFLYLVRSDSGEASDGRQPLADFELASRLSMFLWGSVPDDELLALAAEGQLNKRDALTKQVSRMLADPRSRRFSKHFVRQWLGMQLLDYLQVDRKAYPQLDPALKEALQQEPIAFFHEVLQSNRTVLDFIHADYTMANERLAKHYGLANVHGNHFRRVELPAELQRGGLLTQAGLLAMNSDGKDSHPLKRGIWLLKSLLNDPPPPPPPAVPEIDLADPEIAKLSLKERIENHRNHAACMSCHAKIDPWGIAFENFDAVGSWRTVAGGKPVDASSQLFNGQKLDGVDGLKRFLLQHRQDQFARALVHKMTTYALGRPLRFGDRSSIDQITADLRKQGDGLATLVTLIVTSDLFQSQ